MVDWNGLLNTKYQLLQQNADANTTRANAEANLQNQNAAQVQQNAISARGLQGAQTDLTGKQAKFYGQEALSRIGLQNSQAGLNTAQTAEVAPNAASTRTLQGLQGGLIGQQTNYFGPEAEARIKGIGANTLDTEATTATKNALRPGAVGLQNAQIGQTEEVTRGARLGTNYLEQGINPFITQLLGSLRLNSFGLGSQPYPAVGGLPYSSPLGN